MNLIKLQESLFSLLNSIKKAIIFVQETLQHNKVGIGIE